MDFLNATSLRSWDNCCAPHLLPRCGATSCLVIPLLAQSASVGKAALRISPLLSDRTARRHRQIRREGKSGKGRRAVRESDWSETAETEKSPYTSSPIFLAIPLLLLYSSSFSLPVSHRFLDWQSSCHLECWALPSSSFYLTLTLPWKTLGFFGKISCDRAASD